MPFAEALVRLFAPHVCVGCGVERDRLLCDDCRASLATIPSRCYRCHAATKEYAVCVSCRPRTPLRHVYVMSRHEGLPKELLHHAKYERARAGLDEVAELMAPLLSRVDPTATLVPAPTATSRVRQRGYDQSRVITRRLSQLSGLVYNNVLARFGQAHQVGSGRAARLAHLQGAFRVTHARQFKNQHIVLVDDVLTTGATLETAAKVLRRAGAHQVDAIVFTQPS